MEQRSERYRAEIAYGTDQYHDVIDRLTQLGLPSSFTQTGGQCAAIHCQLDDGDYLLITDVDDSLSWQREAQHGWSVGRYQADSQDPTPLRFASHESGDVDTLIALIGDVQAAQK